MANRSHRVAGIIGAYRDVGKWRHQLTAEQQRAITDHFAPFLTRFGYA